MKIDAILETGQDPKDQRVSIRLYQPVQNENIQIIDDSIHILDPSRNMGYWVIKVHTGLFVAPQSFIFLRELIWVDHC